MELQKEWYNRLSTEMNLAEHYLSDQRVSESLVQFKTDAVNRELKRLGADAEWTLDRPVNVYYQFGQDHAEVIWKDPTGDSSLTIQMFMDYRIDSKGRGQWQMKIVQPLRFHTDQASQLSSRLERESFSGHFHPKKRRLSC